MRPQRIGVGWLGSAHGVEGPQAGAPSLESDRDRIARQRNRDPGFRYFRGAKLVLRMSVFSTHPIQYMVPLWRRIASDKDVCLRVHYFSDVSVRGGVDPGFGVPVAWDVPVLDGYEYVFLERDADLRGYRRARVPRLKQRLVAEQTDCVLVHGYTHDFERQVVSTARGMGLRTLLRGELTDAPRPGRKVWKRWVRGIYLEWFYRRIDGFCCIGQNSLAHLRRYRIPDRRIFFSPYSVDGEFFESQREEWPRDKARQHLGIPENCKVALLSGKLIPRKQPLLLARALRRVRGRHRLHLIVLGDGPLMEPLHEEIKSVLESRCTMPGFVNQSELGSYFGASDFLVLPSSFETWGLVVNEAMHFGLPAIISSSVGCGADLVRQGETGLVFQEGDVSGLASALERLIQPGVARRMGEAALEHIQGYSIEASAAGVIEAMA